MKINVFVVLFSGYTAVTFNSKANTEKNRQFPFDNDIIAFLNLL